MEQTITVPPVSIEPWSKLVMSQDEIQNTLTYLAYKTGRHVIFRLYAEDEGYSENTISVQVTATNGVRNANQVREVMLGGKVFKLTKNQCRVDLGNDVPEKNHIIDDNALTLAYVDHNRIIIPIELTAANNEAARTLLAHIVERSIGLLDFKMDGKLHQQRQKLVKSFCQAFARGVQKRITEREWELREKERESEKAYYTIVDCERERPVIEGEIEYLKKLEKIDEPRLFRKEAEALIELQISGQFTSITANEDGSFTAITSPITIEHDGWRFPLGRYTIHLEPAGKIKIEDLDPHGDAEHPHPHVATDGQPCLGNIKGDIPKMLGSMRIAEALQVLHVFLSEYNPDGPYEKISHFDPTGEYHDEDESPCDDCDERCSSYCIFECGNNDGQYDCHDCYDYRTDYCYLDCRYNENFSQFKPCDDCDDKGTEHCCLECEYNDEWQLYSPCDNCTQESCESECPFYAKRQETKEVIENAVGG